MREELRHDHISHSKVGIFEYLDHPIFGLCAHCHQRDACTSQLAQSTKGSWRDKARFNEPMGLRIQGYPLKAGQLDVGQVR
jgi:hypothetical protein